jgi:hypothetical protein
MVVLFSIEESEGPRPYVPHVFAFLKMITGTKEPARLSSQNRCWHADLSNPLRYAMFLERRTTQKVLISTLYSVEYKIKLA